MKRYPLIGVPTVIPIPTETVNPMTGIVLAPGTLGMAVTIAGDGMILQNEGATARLTGRTALVVENTDISVNLVVTPAVTAKMTEACGAQISPVLKTITIPAGGIAIIGPFTQANEDVNKKVSFSFAGDEGRCYAIYIR